MVEWIVSSSVLIAGLILLRFVLKGKISLRLQYTLWSLVLIRLLMPFSLGSSSISVMNPVENSTLYQYTTETVTAIRVPSDTIRDSELTIDEAKQAGNGTLHRVEGYAQESGRGHLHTYSFTDSLLAVGGRVLRRIWLCGIALLGIWFVISNLRLLHSLKKTRILLSSDHALPVYLSDAIDTPCLFGLFRPAIYLTREAAVDEKTMRHAVEHELTHYHHKDNIWAILRSVCLAVHWYNPLVWCAAVLSRNDAELACDESTILRLGEDERAPYGRTLIHLTCEKRPALLNTATTMTGSGKSIKERISLIAKKPKMAGYTLAAVILIAVFAVGCTFTGAPDTPDDSSEVGSSTLTDQYASVEDYITKQAAGQNTVTLLVYEDPSDSAVLNPVEAKILDRKLESLDYYGNLEGLAPNGTLEAWGYDWLIKPDPAEIDPVSIALPGGMYLDEDGYVCLNERQLVIALRYSDGSYDILGEEPCGDGLDFFGYHENTAESLYDWYVKQNDLDLPLYVEDWSGRITIPEGGDPGNFPVHRYDGDGWYIYIPVSGWYQQKTAFAGKQWMWTSEYNTGSTLTVDKYESSLEVLWADAQKQGYTPLDSKKLVWERSGDGVSGRYYFREAADGGCFRVSILWTDTNITDYPYIAIEPEVLRLMAESFTGGLQSPPHNDILTGYITIEDGRVYLDEVEIITKEDTARIEELGLTIQGDLISGYYIHNETEETAAYELSEETIYRFVDSGQLYTSEEGLNYETTSLEEFLAGSSYAANTAANGSDLPTGRIPYLVEVKDGLVISITEEFSYTL